MNNFEFIENRLGDEVNRVEFILSKCRGKRVLDLGCVQHTAEWAIKSPCWLHKKILDVAEHVIGIDYAKSEVNKLQKLGFNVITADVTRPLPIKDKFDVIVAGNLIEHLDNFKGFFGNLKNILKSDGVVLISTANPFYFDQYFYSALKNNVLINPEHTCWIDPIALNQLAARFGFQIREFHFVKERWSLKNMIFESRKQTYDMFHGKWVRNREPHLVENILGNLLFRLFVLFCKFNVRWRKHLSKYSYNELKDELYKKFVSQLFQIPWGFYKMFIIRSKMNKYELYIAVLELI